MSNENLQPNVAEMLRMTGDNTAQFMEHVASHIEKLEQQVKDLSARITELEVGGHDSK
jgi:polyhydroxyalkanoate synthesis regulator phasin